MERIQSLLNKAWQERRNNNYDQARVLVDEALAECEKNDFLSLGRIFHIYMQFESDQDHYQKALEYSLQSIGFYQKAKDANKIAHSTRHLADLQFQLGQYQESESTYQQALTIYRKNANTNKGDLANALRGYGLVLEKLGKVKKAILVWKEVKQLYEAVDLEAGVEEAAAKLEFLHH